MSGDRQRVETWGEFRTGQTVQLDNRDRDFSFRAAVLVDGELDHFEVIDSRNDAVRPVLPGRIKPKVPDLAPGEDIKLRRLEAGHYETVRPVAGYPARIRQTGGVWELTRHDDPVTAHPTKRAAVTALAERITS